MERVTIKDVAKVAGVSYATVSRALSGSPEVSEETRTRIDRICQEMGYMPNSMARAMVVRHSNIIGLIMPSVNNSFMSEMADSIEVSVRQAGYNLMLCNTSYDFEQEKKSFELLIGRQADGIIFIPSGFERYDDLRPYLDRVPTVVLNENTREMPESCVAVDNTYGVRLAVEYLYGLGHRRILYLGYREGSVTHRLRRQGYERACKKLGLEPMVLTNPLRKSSIEAGYALAKEWFAKEAAGQAAAKSAGDGKDTAGKEAAAKELSCTAVFCAADSLALGLMLAADEAGVRIPEDLSLMGFDNIAFSSLPRINLTTINQPERDMAQASVTLLLEQIKDPSREHTRSLLIPSLVERGTCRRLEA